MGRESAIETAGSCDPRPAPRSGATRRGYVVQAIEVVLQVPGGCAFEERSRRDFGNAMFGTAVRALSSTQRGPARPQLVPVRTALRRTAECTEPLLRLTSARSPFTNHERQNAPPAFEAGGAFCCVKCAPFPEATQRDDDCKSTVGQGRHPPCRSRATQFCNADPYSSPALIFTSSRSRPSGSTVNSLAELDSA